MMIPSFPFSIGVVVCAIILVAGSVSLNRLTNLKLAMNLSSSSSVTMTTLLQCSSQGDMLGFQEFVDLFQNVGNACGHLMPSLNAYYNCTVKRLGILNEERKPDFENIERFFGRLFSETFFEKIPFFKEALVGCAESYVTDYNEMTETELLTMSGELSGTFVYCVLDTEEEFSDTMKQVCRGKKLQ